jgi:hypothetical protein
MAYERTTGIHVYLLPTELAAIRVSAARAGKSASSYARELLMEHATASEPKAAQKSPQLLQQATNQ